MMNQSYPIEGTKIEETFRIGELAREFDVTLRTLRFYEDKGLLSPRRVGNVRLYSRGDRARLRIILLGKRVGFSLKDIREILELYDPNSNNSRQLEVSIEKGETQLGKLHDERKKLDESIDELETTLTHLRQLLVSAQ
ncbi:MAG: MerR family DNA-binding transcriptional regulator [Pseudomonadota bacterium]